MADEQKPNINFGKLERIKRLGPIFKTIEVYLQGQYIVAFDVQGRGKNWPERRVPNLAGIIKDLKEGGPIKARRYAPRDALVDTGRLKGSGGTRVVGNTIYWGTTVPYAGKHQWGGTSTIENPIGEKMKEGNVRSALKELKRKGYEKEAAKLIVSKRFTITVPARPFLEVLPEDYTAIVEIIAEGLEV